MQEHELAFLGKQEQAFVRDGFFPERVVVDMPQVRHSAKRALGAFLHPLHEQFGGDSLFGCCVIQAFRELRVGDAVTGVLSSGKDDRFDVMTRGVNASSVFSIRGNTSGFEVIMNDGNLHLGRRGRLGARAVAISFDLDHRRSFFFHDFLDELVVGSVLDFESPVECFHVRHLVDFALAMATG